MRKELLLMVGVALSGCQTGGLNTALNGPHAGKQTLTKHEAACADAANKAARVQANAAVLGSVLSMAGGLGGLTGSGGAIAGQAASIGGSVLQAQATGGAQSEIARNCYG